MSVLRSGEAYLKSLKELHFKVVWSLEMMTQGGNRKSEEVGCSSIKVVGRCLGI